MSEALSLPVLNHTLADDELRWIKAIQVDFNKARADFRDGRTLPPSRKPCGRCLAGRSTSFPPRWIYQGTGRGGMAATRMDGWPPVCF